MTAWGRRAMACCMWLAVMLVAVTAFAQRIVLVRPRLSDPQIRAAFAHLQGELAIHEFEVVVIDTGGAAGPDDLEQAAEQHSAVAAISLVRSRDVAAADIWISDRVTGKTSRRSVAMALRSEGPRLLAVRAVDLLRASLREFGPTSEPPADIVGATPARAPDRVLDWAAPTPDRAGRFAVEASAVLQGTPSGFSPAFGPSIALGYDPSQRLALRLSFQGPLWRARYETDNARATLLQEQLLAEVRWRFWSSEMASLAALGALGAHRLSVEGQAEAPYQPERDAAWSALASLGFGASWHLAPSAALSLRGRTLLLAPRPVVNVGADRVAFGLPSLQLATGLDVSF